MSLSLLLADLNTELNAYLLAKNSAVINPAGEITVEIASQDLLSVSALLKNHEKFKFNALIDLCGVDYLTYGLSEWVTDKATGTGFDRAVMNMVPSTDENAGTRRFAVVYHLLSYVHNQRIRLKVYVDQQLLIIPSVSAIWPCAEWYEREVFDLYGILFEQHPDLRRILTDYGFIGHPFRKDFPLSGHVEVCYDEKQKRVVYAPVKIVPRILVPKVIREKPVKSQNMSD